MEYIGLFVVALLVFAFWGTLRVLNRKAQEGISLSAEMAVMGLRDAHREQKFNVAQKWTSKDLNADNIAKAKVNMTLVDELDI